jgi:hypothetical protein
LRSADAATEIIDLARHHPLRAETVCLLTDDAHFRLTCIVVEGGGEPDDVLELTELLHELAFKLPLAHVTLASCRPGHGFEEADVDRWFELTATLAEADVQLVEWFIQDETMLVAVSPLARDGSRWPS